MIELAFPAPGQRDAAAPRRPLPSGSRSARPRPVRAARGAWSARRPAAGSRPDGSTGRWLLVVIAPHAGVHCSRAMGTATTTSSTSPGRPQQAGAERDGDALGQAADVAADGEGTTKLATVASDVQERRDAQDPLARAGTIATRHDGDRQLDHEVERRVGNAPCPGNRTAVVTDREGRRRPASPAPLAVRRWRRASSARQPGGDPRPRKAPASGLVNEVASGEGDGQRPAPAGRRPARPEGQRLAHQERQLADGELHRGARRRTAPIRPGPTARSGRRPGGRRPERGPGGGQQRR